uniref:Pericentrin/AKAP-450 centrosomal targeting domain-containing protein n=1 Tax=Erpetoichthys calabaricus TaxID=27687 RepID=A0A8C4TIP4_ERPCA
MEVRKQPATSEVMLDSVLEAQLQTEREALDRKEKEISNLEEQLEQFREELENKNEEIQQLNMQMEIQRKTLGTQQQELENQNLLLKEVECLNEQVEKLQQQLEFSQDKKLESQVEFQRSDLERLKIKSEDEIEQLNEVIEKLQLELAHIENKSQDVYNSEEAQHMEKALVKMLKEEDSDRQIEKGSEEVNLPKEEFEAMKQNIYLTNQELEFLKGDRMRLLDKISHLEHSFAINEDSAHKVKMLEEVLQEKTATLLVIQAELNAVEESANSHITNLEAKLEELEFAVQIKDTEFNQYYVRAKDIENDNVVLQQKVLELEERLNQGTRSPSLNQASHSTLKKQSNINTKELYDKQGKNEEAIPEIVSIEMQAVAENILTVDGDSQKDEETQNSIMEESETKLNCLIVKLADLEEELTKLDENQELQRQLLYSTEKDKAEYEKKLAKLTVLLELMRKPAVEKEKMQRVLGKRQQLKNSLAEAQEQLDSEILKSVGTSLDEKQKPENESNLTFFKDKSSLPRINASSQTDEAVTFGDNSVLEHAILKDSEVQIDFKDQNDSSEEIAEMIRSYTEKIGQMQELHAAEIMDMETRHICESESLKRDSHILREECKALNNMVAKMNSTEVYSGSDLSQRLYLTSEPQRQEYRTIPEEEWRENEVFSSDVLPERIKNLLREVHQEGMQILSLSEASYPEEKPLSSDLFSETWQKERRALIDTVESLKILITKMQPSLDFASAQDHTDWRGDLLQAIQQIFQKEHGILKHTLISLAHSLETSDSMMCLNQLVHTINEQVFQIVIKPESRQSMESIQELQELLQSERTLVTKLKTEIAQTKVELETTLKVQHKHLKEMEILRYTVLEITDLEFPLEDQAYQNSQLGSSVEHEDQAVSLLKKQIEMEKALHESQLSHEKKHISELQVLLESERARAMELSNRLEQQKSLWSQLEKQTSQQATAERAVEGENIQEAHNVRPMEQLLVDLEDQLDEKHNRIVELVGDMEKYKLEIVQIKQQLDEEKQIHQADILKEKDACRILQEEVKQLRCHTKEVEEQLDKLKQQVFILQQERCGLQDKIKQIQDKKGPEDYQDKAEIQERSGGEKVKEFLWLQNSIQDVVSQLQQLTMIPPAEISGVVPNRSASGSLTERLLRQNAELTGFVSRLTEEKNDLRNSVIRLEEELRRYRQCSFDVIHTDREKWAREKCNLEKSLRQAEAEVSKLRAELRNDALCREVAGSDGESAVLKRLYGKYLRAESFRKALIYQKKYLLLLLGGFQECERATLSLIARMGGHPSHTSLDIITHHCRAFIRFRSIVRVSIAVSRMKFLVRRWQRVTESGSISNSSINRNGFGHLPGSLETYGERRHTSRGRSGMESPRSALSVQNRYQSGPVDSNSGPLPCSNLQNYDPDRALTDYIHRLEALQRRLGSVPSGNVSNALKFILMAFC